VADGGGGLVAVGAGVLVGGIGVAVSSGGRVGVWVGTAVPVAPVVGEGGAVGLAVGLGPGVSDGEGV
jgi:hypothetical protein